MTKIDRDGDVSLYYLQASLYKDTTFDIPLENSYITFEWIAHTINGSILPYIDELSIYTPDGNVTAFTDLDVIDFPVGSKSQGIFYRSVPCHY
jgi:hypothetical protein